MQKALKIFMKFFLIALFRHVHGLLFRNKMKIPTLELRLVKTKALAHETAETIAFHGIAIAATDGDG